MRKKNDPRGVVCPCPGVEYMHMITIFNFFFSETAWLIKAKFYVGPPWEKKVYINGPGHMTRMAATPIYGQSLQKFPTELSPMIMKLDMQYYELKLYTVYINDDPELTLTYFTAISNWTKLVFLLMVGPYIR